MVNAGPGYPEDMSERVTGPYLLRRGIRRLNAVIITDCKAGNCGGLPGLCEQVVVNRVYLPRPAGRPDANRTYFMVLKELRKKNVPVEFIRPGSRLEPVPGVTVEVFPVGKGLSVKINTGGEALSLP
jgi:beta-lactamase superfamily II metal-dependent hydrolase